MNKYKTFEKLKEELGDRFEEFMYNSNIELLEKIDKAREYTKHIDDWDIKDFVREDILDILEDKWQKKSRKY